MGFRSPYDWRIFQNVSFWPERAEGQCKQFGHHRQGSEYRSPSVHQGMASEVFRPRISVRGIQESTGNPGLSQHMNWEGHIWPGTHFYTKLSPNLGVVAPGEQVGVSCWQTKHQHFDTDCGSRPRVGLALPSLPPLMHDYNFFLRMNTTSARDRKKTLLTMGEQLFSFLRNVDLEEVGYIWFSQNFVSTRFFPPQKSRCCLQTSWTTLTTDTVDLGQKRWDLPWEPIQLILEQGKE